MAAVAKVHCPRCKRGQPVRPDASMYYCDECRDVFGDPNDDDGGDYFSDPTKRIELEDERRQSKAKANTNERNPNRLR